MQTTTEAHGDARIVCVTSVAFRFAPPCCIIFKNLQTKQDLAFSGRWRRCAQSKLANILYGSELAMRHPSVSVAAVHPGVIKTDLVNTLGFADRMLVAVPNIGKILTAEKGMQNQLWAATVDKSDLQSGAYCEPVGQLGKPSKYSQDERLATELWDWTQTQFQGHKV